VIGTRLLNLNDADGGRPEPTVQGNWPGGTGGDLSSFDAFQHQVLAWAIG